MRRKKAEELKKQEEELKNKSFVLEQHAAAEWRQVQRAIVEYEKKEEIKPKLMERLTQIEKLEKSEIVI